MPLFLPKHEERGVEEPLQPRDEATHVLLVSIEHTEDQILTCHLIISCVLGHSGVEDRARPRGGGEVLRRVVYVGVLSRCAHISSYTVFDGAKSIAPNTSCRDYTIRCVERHHLLYGAKVQGHDNLQVVEIADNPFQSMSLWSLDATEKSKLQTRRNRRRDGKDTWESKMGLRRGAGYVKPVDQHHLSGSIPHGVNSRAAYGQEVAIPLQREQIRSTGTRIRILLVQLARPHGWSTRYQV